MKIHPLMVGPIFELGAGNYGTDGHTKISQSKTVLQRIKVISSAKNYIDDLEEIGTGDYKPEEQYGVLFWTLDHLVSRYGEKGIFHVNDLYEDYANTAAKCLKEYADAKGYHSVIIEVIPGDYRFLNAEENLKKYDKTKYQSVHLKNPESSFYYDQMDGEKFLSSEKSCSDARTLLQHLANLSKQGLYLFILYDDIDYLPLEERKDFVEKDIFYHSTREWEPVPYIFPEGEVISKEGARVFFIKTCD